jgi:hypothetical protein
MMMYFENFYYSLLIMGSNEMGPTRELELIVTVTLLIFASIYNAKIFGDFAIYMTIVNKKSQL